MYKNIHSIFSQRNLQVFALSAFAIAGSFSLGIQSAGEVRPISLIEAGSIQIAGDIDGNGEVDLRDVISILEIVQGYSVATPEQMRADPNRDGKLTVDDAIRILSQLSLR
ncbi:MAG: dockerin type I repeat-containing protein [bacterium]|nr:dockerin type I repeat-containing protein [bacterium]